SASMTTTACWLFPVMRRKRTPDASGNSPAHCGCCSRRTGSLSLKCLDRDRGCSYGFALKTGWGINSHSPGFSLEDLPNALAAKLGVQGLQLLVRHAGGLGCHPQVDRPREDCFLVLDRRLRAEHEPVPARVFGDEGRGEKPGHVFPGFALEQLGVGEVPEVVGA